MTDDVKTHVKSKTTWTRLLYIILYAITYKVASLVLLVITILQFVKSLLTGSPFAQLQSFGGSLAEYNRQLVAFLSYQSDAKPYPIDRWPSQTPPAPPSNATDDDVIIVAEAAEEKKAPRTPRPKSQDKSDAGGDVS
ncbi:DUF4389 domain-containing protein [Sneathiella sp.]|uniref:DUF4389 domain-containing protein n=1 Tax=Sneathiella sp. TaxID=1964365 RepID=UPI0035622C9E